jgi:hypothetical protein
VVVPVRPLHRFAPAELGFGRRRRATVRVADGKPGEELQVDFGRLGLIPDPVRGSRRVVHGLVFTAVYSRHLFVYPIHRQSLEQVIAGFEAAWAFFGGVFKVVIPENVPWNIFRVLWPALLCGPGSTAPFAMVVNGAVGLFLAT